MLSRVDTCRQPGSLDARSDATVKQQAMWSYRSPRVHKGWLSGTRGEVMPGRKRDDLPRQSAHALSDSARSCSRTECVCIPHNDVRCCGG
jgi:hypothetical protein